MKWKPNYNINSGIKERRIRFQETFSRGTILFKYKILVFFTHFSKLFKVVSLNI